MSRTRPNYVARNAVGPAANGIIDAAGEALIVDIEDLTRVEVYIVQETDAGTVSIDFQRSPDGITYVKVGDTITEADFPAGDDTAVTRTISTVDGSELPAKKLRVIATALAGGGAYQVKVAGFQKDGYA
jgi:hypothetical protein